MTYTLYVLNVSIDPHTSVPPSHPHIHPLETIYQIIDYYYSETGAVTEKEALSFFKKHNMKITQIITITEEQFNQMNHTKEKTVIKKGDIVKFFGSSLPLKVIKSNSKKTTVTIPYRHWNLIYEDDNYRFKKTDEPYIDNYPQKSYTRQVLIHFPHNLLDIKEIILANYRLSLLYTDAQIISYSSNKEAVKLFRELNLPYTLSKRVPDSKIIISDDERWLLFSNKVYQYSDFLEPFVKNKPDDYYRVKFLYPKIKDHLIPYYYSKVKKNDPQIVNMTKPLKVMRSNKNPSFNKLFIHFIERRDIHFVENLLTFFSQLGIKLETTQKHLAIQQNNEDEGE